MHARAVAYWARSGKLSRYVWGRQTVEGGGDWDEGVGVEGMASALPHQAGNLSSPLTQEGPVVKDVPCGSSGGPQAAPEAPCGSSGGPQAAPEAPCGSSGAVKHSCSRSGDFGGEGGFRSCMAVHMDPNSSWAEDGYMHDTAVFLDPSSSRPRMVAHLDPSSSRPGPPVYLGPAYSRPAKVAHLDPSFSKGSGHWGGGRGKGGPWSSAAVSRAALQRGRGGGAGACRGDIARGIRSHSVPLPPPSPLPLPPLCPWPQWDHGPRLSDKVHHLCSKFFKYIVGALSR